MGLDLPTATPMPRDRPRQTGTDGLATARPLHPHGRPFWESVGQIEIENSVGSSPEDTRPILASATPVPAVVRVQCRAPRPRGGHLFIRAGMRWLEFSTASRRPCMGAPARRRQRRSWTWSGRPVAAVPRNRAWHDGMNRRVRRCRRPCRGHNGPGGQPGRLHRDRRPHRQRLSPRPRVAPDEPRPTGRNRPGPDQPHHHRPRHPRSPQHRTGPRSHHLACIGDAGGEAPRCRAARLPLPLPPTPRPPDAAPQGPSRTPEPPRRHRKPLPTQRASPHLAAPLQVHRWGTLPMLSIRR